MNFRRVQPAAYTTMKLNVEFFPNFENTRNSYAELLIKAGKLNEAQSIIANGLRLATKSDNTLVIK